MNELDAATADSTPDVDVYADRSKRKSASTLRRQASARSVRDRLPACWIGRVALLEPSPANRRAANWTLRSKSGLCCYCEHELSEDCIPTPAHSWPVSSGGAPDGVNIAGLACWKCNALAGDSYVIDGQRIHSGRLARADGVAPAEWIPRLDDGYRIVLRAGSFRTATRADVDTAIRARAEHVDGLCSCE